MLAEGAGGEFLIGGLVTLCSSPASRIEVAADGGSRIEVVTIGGFIGGADCVVAGMESTWSSLLALETGLTDRSRAGVLDVDPDGTPPKCPRVMRVYSASIPSLSYAICIGRLPREYFAVT